MLAQESRQSRQSHQGGDELRFLAGAATPVTSLLLAEIAAEFLPPGVLNVVCGNAATGRALVAHEIPQMVSRTCRALTASVRSGRLRSAVREGQALVAVHLAA